MLNTKAGLGTYNGANGLSDLSNVNIVGDVVQGVSYATNPNYYLDLILGALNRTLPFTVATRDTEPMVMNVTVSASQQVTLPLSSNGGLNYAKINWGDGSGWLDIDAYNDANCTHIYTSAGNYNVSLAGYIRGFVVENGGFKNIINSVSSWGTVQLYELNFKGCSNLTTLPNGSIPETYRIENFFYTFNGCTNLQAIPSGMFDNMDRTMFFTDTFNGCTSLTTIPSGLFDNNVRVESFRETFLGCTSLTTIPSGLFDNNTAVTNFYRTFSGCYALATVPQYLFRNNTIVYNYYQTFYNCIKLQLNKWIFYASGEEATRFSNYPPYAFDFTSTFYRYTFNGTQGEAPELWNCTYSRTPVTSTNCFSGSGNNLTSLSNYNSIDVAWK
jgi:hypothetical protein